MAESRRAAPERPDAQRTAATAPTARQDALGAELGGLRVGGPAGAGPMLALQRSVGNAAVGMLLRQVDPVPKAATGPLADAYNAARQAKEAFVDGGKKGPITYDPSKRNKRNYYGGFDVAYDPADDQQLLTITMRGVADFRPGMLLKKGRAVPNEPSPQTAQAAKKINALKDPADRATEVAKWHWTSDGGPDVDDETTFMDTFQTAVQDAWRGQHAFTCTRQYWEDLGATVDLDISLVKQDATHKPGSPFHMQTIVFKVPAGFVGGSADVHRSSGGAKGGAFSNVMTVTAADVDPRRDELLIRRVGFDAGSSTVSAKRVKALKAFAKELPNAPKGATAPVADLTITTQGADAAERQARFDAIAKVLTDAGMSASRLTFIGGATGDVAEIVIGSGDVQTVVAHESGHMFGLDDEYTGPGDYAPGKKTEHTELAAQAGESGIVHAKSDSIMSEGGVVRRQHYVTFLDALKVVTGIEEWTFGDPHEVEPPSPYEDAPIPGELYPGGPIVEPKTALA